MTILEILAQHRTSMGQISLSELFEKNPLRAQQLSFSSGGVTLDISKNHITDQSLSFLVQWAKERNLSSGIDALFRGDEINSTEGRAVIHPLLRDANSQVPVAIEARSTLKKIVAFSEAVQAGVITSATNEQFSDVVNIGVGGSDLGPRMVSEALKPYRVSTLKPHFVANIDPQDFFTTVAELNPKTTLFIVASKSFGTQETLENMKLAQQWLADTGIHHWQKHLTAVTANPLVAKKLGFDSDKIFQFDEGVGGRYSVWSAVGMILLLVLGEKNFSNFLQGASAMDEHFKTAPLQKNLPVLLALVYAWYRNFWRCQSHAVLPYAHGLHLLPNYLQQLEMESLGKSVGLNNQAVQGDTGGVIWGAAGTVGQHSFHQLLHQGTVLIPSDFIAVLKPTKPHQARGHQMLLANCIAQSRTLMTGKSRQQIEKELAAYELSEGEIDTRSRHGVMSGNRPSTLIILDTLTPESLGALMALYEHKVFVLSQLWRVNAFDQWGVEYGKQVSRSILDALSSGVVAEQQWDSSTLNLIKIYKQTLEKTKD